MITEHTVVGQSFALFPGIWYYVAILVLLLSESETCDSPSCNYARYREVLETSLQECTREVFWDTLPKMVWLCEILAIHKVFLPQIFIFIFLVDLPQTCWWQKIRLLHLSDGWHMYAKNGLSFDFLSDHHFLLQVWPTW